MKKMIQVSIPLLIFLFLFSLLCYGLKLDPHRIPSALIGKPAPDFSLINLQDSTKIITQKDLLGHLSLVNIWASWCPSCRDEHEFLMKIAQSGRITILGFDYKDEDQNAKQWLAQLGNPYQLVGVDKDGLAAINWGIYGTPETFLVDAKGIIRYKHVGPMTKKEWRKNFLPLIQKLEQDNAKT